MTEKRTEQDLLAECRNGDREAFESLYNQNQKRVFSVALNFFGGNTQLAEDVTQQVFLKIFNKIADFRGDAEVTTWISHPMRDRYLDSPAQRCPPIEPSGGKW